MSQPTRTRVSRLASVTPVHHLPEHRWVCSGWAPEISVTCLGLLLRVDSEAAFLFPFVMHNQVSGAKRKKLLCRWLQNQSVQPGRKSTQRRNQQHYEKSLAGQLRSNSQVTEQVMVATNLRGWGVPSWAQACPSRDCWAPAKMYDTISDNRKY